MTLTCIRAPRALSILVPRRPILSTFVSVVVIRVRLKTTKAPHNMKRAATSAKESPKGKKQRIQVPEYHLTPTLKDLSGEEIWPAPRDQMAAARAMILEW
jgi:hypothetical protein